MDEMHQELLSLTTDERSYIFLIPVLAIVLPVGLVLSRYNTTRDYVGVAVWVVGVLLSILFGYLILTKDREGLEIVEQNYDGYLLFLLYLLLLIFSVVWVTQTNSTSKSYCALLGISIIMLMVIYYSCKLKRRSKTLFFVSSALIIVWFALLVISVSD